MLYETMFKRKSIRKYNQEALDEKTLAEIKTHINSIEKLDKNIKTELKIITNNEVKVSSVKAPHYIAFFSEEKEGYLTNAGYMLEQMDLILSSNNIGTCWVGMGSPIKELDMQSDLKFVILLAFGNSLEPVHRNSLSEFNRKKVEQISNIDNELIQAVRLAPSAVNSQPWYFEQSNECIDAYIAKNNIIKNAVLGRMNKIDIGISLCYLSLVVKHNNREVLFEKVSNNKIKSYEYVVTAKIV